MPKSPEPTPRSEQRHQTTAISIRCTETEKRRCHARAERQGFASLSAWIKDLIKSEGGMSLRMRQMISGRLGQIGGRVSGLPDLQRRSDVRAEALLISQDLQRLQTQIRKGDADAGEGDS